MEEIKPAKIRSPADPHIIKLRVSESETKKIVEKVSKDVPSSWLPRLWKIETQGKAVIIKIPSTKLTAAQFEEVAKKIKFYLFGK